MSDDSEHAAAPGHKAPILVALWIIAPCADPVGRLSLGLFIFKSQGIFRKLREEASWRTWECLSLPFNSRGVIHIIHYSYSFSNTETLT